MAQPSEGDDTRAPPADITAEEREALHQLQLGVEHIHRAYGHLLAFHHQVGHAMDQFAAAGESLRAAGHDHFADTIRDDLLPAGVVGDRWSYELVADFEEGFLAETTGFERGVRRALVDGLDHVSERAQQRDWRARAERD
jgi:hypothetical protein